jgi:hypothetical protein
VLSTKGIISKKWHESLMLLNLRPAPYTLMQKAAVLNTYRIVGEYWVEQRIGSGNRIV